MVESVTTNPDGTTTVLASLNDELVIGTWDNENDVVDYKEPFKA